MREPNVKQIRQKLGMTQVEFAAKFGINLCTLRDWEQGRNNPSGAARVLLLVISREPAAALAALAAA